MENVCVVCGGTQFYKDAGFFYCKECQTQTQDVVEAVFESADPNSRIVTGVRKKRIVRKKKVDHRLTSWECYNHILLGLVNELIDIGAKKALKGVVKYLWFKYLEKCEVVPKTADKLPKLNALHTKKDAELIYGRATSKRKRSRSVSPSSTDSTPSARTKKSLDRKSFHESDYSMQKEQTQDSFASNQNLQSVTSSLSTEPKKPTAVVYANPSKTELLKLYSKKHHFKRHCEDEDCEMACHKVTYRTLTRPFKYGPTVLTRNKLFGIIYLGLLIIKDKIQLGDLLRFIREGHLSYNNVEHLFPEETETEKFDVGTYNSRTMFLTHFGLRTTAASLAVWLEVIDHIHVQNLVALCERYCKELELPVQVAQCAVKLMSRAPPSMKFTKTTKAVPNYEARAISFVIFAMKLLFGLDDVTEHEFSRYAETINKKAAGLDFAVPRMFVWDEWIKFIQYRKLVVKEHHFPTNFLYDKTVQNPDLLITFLTEQKEKYNLNKTTSVTYDVLRQLLLKLNPQPPKKITFPISLTPFHDYVDAITFHNENLLPIIQQKFGNTSLDFLLRPYHYLKFANNNANVKVVHHGKNNKLVFEDIRNYQLEQWRERKRLKDERVVKISTDFEDLLEQIEEKPLVIETNNNAKDHEGIVQSHKKWNKDLHAVNIVKTRKVSDGTLLDDFEQVASLQCENPYSVHYNPHERYWFRSQDVTRVKKVEFDEFFEKFPYSFSLLFQECARIVEQSEKDLFLEFNNVELYLSYVANYSAAKHDRMYTVVDREIRKLINQAKTQW